MTTTRILVAGWRHGGYFGGRLAQAGRDVTFLARPERATQLRDDGWHIDDGENSSPIEAPITTPEDPPEGSYDVVLIAVKAQGLEWAVEHTVPLLAEDGVVIPLLNGLAQVEVLSEAFGADRVLGGSARIVTHLDDEGNVRWRPPLAKLTLGELGGGLSDRALELAEVLEVEGIEVVVSPNMTGELWRKWYFIVAAGVAGVLGRGPLGAIVSTEGGLDLVEAVLEESAEVAAAAGYPATEGEISYAHGFLTDPDSTFVSSLYRDIVAGNPGESEHLVGDFARRARELGSAAPLSELALLQMRVSTREISADNGG